MAIIKKFRIRSFKKLDTVIEFENVSLTFGNRLILDNLNFKVNKGSIHGMLGPNGAGKSTLLRTIHVQDGGNCQIHRAKLCQSITFI